MFSKNRTTSRLKKDKTNDELLIHAKQVIEKGIKGLYEIQEINREGSTSEKKVQRINAVIYSLGKEFIKIKNELS